MPSKIMYINKTNKVTNTLTSFTYPSNNGIFIILNSGLLYKFKPVYYGDEIDMLFWWRLGIEIGEPVVGLEYLTLQTGYRYQYYVDKKKFIVINNDNSTIMTRKNINCLSQLGIDFTIYMSHQFEIYTDGSGSSQFNFLIPVNVYKNKEIGKILWGSVLRGESYLPPTPIEPEPDPTKPPNPTDPENKPIASRLGEFSDIDYFKISPEKYLYELKRLEGIYKTQIDQEMFVYYPFYGETEGLKTTEKHNRIRNAVKINIEDMFVIPLLALSLFPALMPIEKVDETRNNRPIYEPFLIWGFFKLIVNKISFDDLKTYLEVFDLSPNWE